MAEEKKQIKATDVQDRLGVIGLKIAFLHDAIVPVGADDETPLGVNNEAAQGLGFILRDIENVLAEITDAQIVTAVSHE